MRSAMMIIVAVFVSVAAQAANNLLPVERAAFQTPTFEADTKQDASLISQWAVVQPYKIYRLWQMPADVFGYCKDSDGHRIFQYAAYTEKPNLPGKISGEMTVQVGKCGGDRNEIVVTELTQW